MNSKVKDYTFTDAHGKTRTVTSFRNLTHVTIVTPLTKAGKPKKAVMEFHSSFQLAYNAVHSVTHKRFTAEILELIVKS